MTALEAGVVRLRELEAENQRLRASCAEMDTAATEAIGILRQKGAGARRDCWRGH